MTTRTPYILSLFILLSCGQNSSTKGKSEHALSPKTIQVEGGQLITGWYYLAEKENGIEKILNGTEETYFLNPRPIVTADNFTEMEIYQSNYGDFGLTIQLDKEGTKQWSIATSKSIEQKLALVIDNELYFTPKVKAQIDVGITALNRGDLSEKELKAIKKKIENEKNNRVSPI